MTENSFKNIVMRGIRTLIPYKLRHPVGLFLLRMRPFVTRCFKSLGLAEVLWRKALPSELQFWDGYLREKNHDWKDDTYAFRVDPNAPLQPFLIELLTPFASANVRILDVGAGPLTCLGKKWNGHQIDLFATDPLASDFDKLLAKYEIIPLTRTLHAHGERLTEFFRDGEFDLVFARNSLDHAYDLPLAIRQMLRLTKPGGFVVLQHYAKEAEKMGYLGLHQWNFFLDGGELVVDNQIVRASLGAICGASGEVIRCAQADRMITAVVRKQLCDR